MAPSVSSTSTSSSSTSSSTSSTGSSTASSATTAAGGTPTPAAAATVTVVHRHHRATLTETRSLVPARWKEGAVRVVGMAECREAALTLAHAFAADDYARYLVDGQNSEAAGGSDGDEDDDVGECSGGVGSSGGGGGGRSGGGGGGRDLTAEEAKWRLHVDILTYTVAAHCMSGLVTAVGAECDSVALWVPPGKHLDGWWTQLRSGAWRLYFQLSPEGRRRYFDEIVPLLHDTKADILGPRDDDTWYLVYLGTRPNSQGRGYAARLLQDMMARADAENRPVYLESSSQANNAYYEKFGFEVQRDVFLERGPVPVRLSIMVREPRVPGCKVAYASPSPMVKNKKFVVVGAKGLVG